MIANIILTYIFLGIVFNALFDLLITYLGDEHEDKRFTVFERIVAMLTWPIPLTKFIFGIINGLKNKK